MYKSINKMLEKINPYENSNHLEKERRGHRPTIIPYSISKSQKDDHPKINKSFYKC